MLGNLLKRYWQDLKLAILSIVWKETHTQCKWSAFNFAILTKIAKYRQNEHSIIYYAYTIFPDHDFR